MATVYDGAFRTILNDCRKLVLPVINEVFGEAYTGDEKIQFFLSEHFLDQQDHADKERITDTNFTVFGYWEGICGTLKYENVQKGVGDMMRGALIETSARVILNQGISQEIDNSCKRVSSFG